MAAPTTAPTSIRRTSRKTVRSSFAMAEPPSLHLLLLGELSWHVQRQDFTSPPPRSAPAPPGPRPRGTSRPPLPRRSANLQLAAIAAAQLLHGLAVTVLNDPVITPRS